ncbi:MAG: hypothetical protein O2894_00085 [Planctomycetota bacterium]|nr:hypothetical protein [Planctomycetota bacterium]
MSRAGLVLLLAVCLLVAAPQPVGAEPPDREARIARLVADLDEFGTACQAAKLFKERNETYELLLRFAPDHPDARKWLKFKRTREGAWERPAGYKPPRNMKTVSAEIVASREAYGNRFADDTLAWIAAREPALTAALRATLLQEVALVAPHRADVRELHGEVQTAEGPWILRESLKAATRRGALKQAAADALADAPAAREDRPNRTENATRIAWKTILQGARVRVVGTVEAAEASRAHGIATAAFPLFEAAYGNPVPEMPNYVFMLVCTDTERDTLLESHPASTAEFRAFAKNLASGWFPKTTTAYARSAEAARRLEWVGRQTMGSLLRRRFSVRTAQGWAFEGFGLYLGHLLTGERQTFYVRRTQYDGSTDRDGDLWEKLTAEGADWRALGRTLLAGPRAPDLRLLLGKEVNQMDTEDLLASFLLAAYILEGRPEQVAAVLEAVGAGKRADEIVEGALGLDMASLELRLRRWLDETK